LTREDYPECLPAGSLLKGIALRHDIMLVKHHNFAMSVDRGYNDDNDKNDVGILMMML